MNNMNIALSQTALESPEEAIQVLIQAAEEITNATEKDFQEMKNTKWYSRLWKLVTFSKDNEKKLANGVSNLAKLQEIVMKAVILLSNQTAQTAELMKENSALLETLCKKYEKSEKVQVNMIRELKRIKSGIEIPLRLDELSDQTRIVIINALLAVEKNIPADDAGQAYLNSVYRAARCSALDIQQVNFSCIEDLRPRETQLLYQVIMEYVYTMTDDFDCDSEIFDFISLPRRKATAIQEQIHLLASKLGKSVLLNHGEDDDLSVVEDEDIEYVEEEPEEEPAPVEYEEITIDSMMQIGKEEVKTFAYKIINLKSIVNCEGRLELDHCVITYNAHTFSDEMVFSNSAALVAKDCEFICKGYDPESFITIEDDSTATFIRCVFKDCSEFIYAEGAGLIRFSYCELLDCARQFVSCRDLYGKANGGFYIEQSNIINSNLAKFNIPTEDNRYDGSLDMFHVSSEVSQVEDVYVTEGPDFRTGLRLAGEKIFGVNESCFAYFQLDNGVVKNSTFVGARGCVSGLTVEGCTFERCTNAFSTERNNKYSPLVENCVFSNCEEIINATENTLITKSKFIDNSGRIITGDSSGNVSITYCEFINTKNTAKDKYQGYDVSNPDASIVLGGSKNAKTNVIEKCIFDGVDIDEGFLIKAACLGKPNGDIISVTGCDFRNCSTKRDSGKIIKTYSYYYGAFDKRHDFEAVSVDSCRGLDQVNKQGKTSKDVKAAELRASVSKSATNKVATGVVAFMLGGPLAAAGVGVVKAITDMKKKKDQEQAEKAAQE